MHFLSDALRSRQGSILLIVRFAEVNCVRAHVDRCHAVGVNPAADPGTGGRAGYRRSAGSPRGEARRRQLLERVTDDLAANGLVDFSLRRAARAAGTTHKVLLYYFDGADDLLR
jgi:AcrR family transcriptional regulator